MKHEALTQVGVKSFVFNKNGELLLIKRNPAKYPNTEQLWDIPGGRIDMVSSLEDNLKREIFEETGLKVKTLATVAAQGIIKPGIRVVRITYISHETSKVPKVILSDEHSDFMWLNIDKVLKIKGLDTYAKLILKDKAKLSFIKDLIHKTLDR